jgi:MFS family permease
MSLAGSLVMMALIGGGAIGAMGMLNTFLVDLYPQSPATAVGVLNFTRCLLSAAGNAVVQYIVEAWGIGWCFTFLGGISILSLPVLLVLLKWGPKWREERFVRFEKKEKAQKENNEPMNEDAVNEETANTKDAEKGVRQENKEI